MVVFYNSNRGEGCKISRNGKQLHVPLAKIYGAKVGDRVVMNVDGYGNRVEWFCGNPEIEKIT